MNRHSCFPSIGQAALLCLAVALLQMMLALPLEVAATVVTAVRKSEPLHPSQHPLTVAIVNLMALGLVLGWGARWARAPLHELFPLKRFRPVLIAPILVTMAGAVILLSEVDNLFRAAFPVPGWLRDYFRFLTEADEHLMSAALAFVIVAPVTEELLFRGLILRGFVRRYRMTTALLVSAVLFALTHLNPWQFCSATAVGVLFAWWLVRTGSLWPALMGHALMNSLVLFHRLLPLQIPGFNAGDPLSGTAFQPLWFDVVGVTLAVIGLLLFKRLQPKPPPFIPEPPRLPK